jgi:hypothetical protein
MLVAVSFLLLRLFFCVTDIFAQFFAQQSRGHGGRGGGGFGFGF